jgi:hypothetical protein
MTILFRNNMKVFYDGFIMVLVLVIEVLHSEFHLLCKLAWTACHT